MNERAEMKIKKGIRIAEDGSRSEERGYCKRCGRSLHQLLKNNKEVEISALGSLAVANTMKAIMVCADLVKEEGKELKLDVPTWKMQENAEMNTSLAIFSIVVSAE